MSGQIPASIYDARIRADVEAGDVTRAATDLLRTLGPEVFGFLRGVVSAETDADEVFAATSERIWRSLAAFRWQCSLRTWVYVIARNEAMRFIQGARRRNAGRLLASSALDALVAAVRTETLSALRSEKRNRLTTLRDELPVDDRTLLILRVDRDMSWEDVARAFLADPDGGSADEIKREAARLRKRFQLVKTRLRERARDEGLLSE